MSAVVLLLGAFVAGRIGLSCAGADSVLAAADQQRVDDIVEHAMSSSTTVGLSLAITHRGRLVFAKAYGHASTESSDLLSTTSQFRIASVSKPLTAIEIMRLVDRGGLRLDQRVFGARSLLGERYGPSSRFADPRVANITVQQLLEHTSGGWDNDSQDGTVDPMFLQPQLDRDALLGWVLGNVKLEYEPGTVQQYSNFGYALLGRVIEQVTGRSYAEAMRHDVFLPQARNASRWPESLASSVSPTKSPTPRSGRTPTLPTGFRSIAWTPTAGGSQRLPICFACSYEQTVSQASRIG